MSVSQSGDHEFPREFPRLSNLRKSNQGCPTHRKTYEENQDGILFEGEIEDQTKVQRFITSETVQETHQVVSHWTDDGQSVEKYEKTYTTCRPKQVCWAEFITKMGYIPCFHKQN